jgi:hypothetical protein
LVHFIFSEPLFPYKTKKIEILFLLYMSSINFQTFNIKMSSNQTNNFNSTKFVNPSDLQPHYQPQTGNGMQVYNSTMLSSNLYLYIPRVGSGATEDYVKTIIDRSNIGAVDYCDITLTKDKDPNKAAFLSAFVKLTSWSPASAACEDFARTKSIRIQLNRKTGEFWILLPNHNPMSRTHLNTTQLAAATDKLFEVTDEITEKASAFEIIMRTQLAEMRALIWNQHNHIAALEHEMNIMRCSEANPIELIIPRGYTYKDSSILGQPTIMGELYPERYAKEYVKVAIIEEDEEEDEEAAEDAVAIEDEAKDDADLDAILEAHQLKRLVSVEAPVEAPVVEPEEPVRDYDAEVDELLDAPMPMTRGVTYSAPLQIPGQGPALIQNNLSMTRGITFYDPEQKINPRGGLRSDVKVAELFASPPQFTRQTSVSSYNEEDECVFSNRQAQGQRRSPILKEQDGSSISTTLGNPLTLCEIVAKNPERAIGSRDLCGNL